MIYFSSDYHFGHDKDFAWGGPLNFTSVEDNSEKIISRHNAIVKDEDDVYILGDIMIGNYEYGLDKIQQLKGKIHIILGNHDSQNRIALYQTLPNVVEIVYSTLIKIGKQHYYLSHYPSFTANYDDKPYHSHIICLYGHTHQGNKFFTIGEEENPFMYNVGVDAHDCTPVSIEEINKDIHEKVNELYQKKIHLTK